MKTVLPSIVWERHKTYLSRGGIAFTQPENQPSISGRKEGRNGFLRCFQQLRSYHDEIETRRNFSSLYEYLVDLLVAAEAPLGCGGRVQVEHPVLALHAGGHPVTGQGVAAGRVGTLVAPHTLTHVPEWGVVVTVRAQRICLKIQRHVTNYSNTQL